MGNIQVMYHSSMKHGSLQTYSIHITLENCSSFTAFLGLDVNIGGAETTSPNCMSSTK